MRGRCEGHTKEACLFGAALIRMPFRNPAQHTCAARRRPTARPQAVAPVLAASGRRAARDEARSRAFAAVARWCVDHLRTRPGGLPVTAAVRGTLGALRGTCSPPSAATRWVAALGRTRRGELIPGRGAPAPLQARRGCSVPAPLPHPLSAALRRPLGALQQPPGRGAAAALEQRRRSSRRPLVDGGMGRTGKACRRRQRACWPSRRLGLLGGCRAGYPHPSGAEHAPA